MKKIFFLTCFLGLFYSINITAQRVDLDKFYFDVTYQELPIINIPKEARTLGIRTKVGDALRSYTSGESLYDGIFIYGWNKVEENPTVGVEIVLDDFLFKGSEIKSETITNKDSKGKIISSKTLFWVVAKYAGRGSGVIEGPKPEIEQKTDEKIEEKPVNMFLANAILDESEEEDESTILNFNYNYIYEGPKSTSKHSISEDFTLNKDAIYSNYLRKFTDEAVERTSRKINNLYGFTPVKTKDFMWIQNSKKHQEYEIQKSAIEAIKVLFGTMNPNEPLDNLEKNLSPLIGYLESIKTKYSDDEKNSQKMRYSSFYNLAKIYYYLDKPEKSNEQLKGLITNGYHAKDGERLIPVNDKLIKQFGKTGLNSRHNSL